MNNNRLRAYAELIAKKGANIQKDQTVIINAQLDQPDFIVMLSEECYKAGAIKAEIKWAHQEAEKIDLLYSPASALSEVHKWEIEKMRHCENTLPAMIYILSEDPDGMVGIDQEKYSDVLRSRRKAFKPFRDRMDNRYQWCIAAVPGKKWAKKIFPDDNTEQAEEKLWEAILDSSRVYNDPIKQWEDHNDSIAKKCTYLNSLKLDRLKYRSNNGTNFTVGLIENSQFKGGAGKTVDGVEYNANIPSEEVFITPKKGIADGVVVSTKPLCFQSELIEDFTLTFVNGKITEHSAKKNGHLLEKMLNMDDGARFLGECALVSFSSPINKAGFLFYNTLFDENASCHLALGAGFNECIDGFEKLTFDECKSLGVNDSIIHEDFMIGSEDMEIIGIDKNGNEYLIFKNGEWNI